jgi:hypothetical protein
MPAACLQGMLHLLRTALHQLAQPRSQAGQPCIRNLGRQGLKSPVGAWGFFHDLRLIRGVLTHSMDR